MAGKSDKKSKPAYTGLQLQTASSVLPIPLVYGMNRVAPNLWWYGDFASHGHSQGKGGGGSSTTYTYNASLIMGLCEGPITGINQVWVDTGTLSTLAALGFTLFTGSIGQSPWGYLTSAHPTQADPYSGAAYLAEANYPLGSSASLPSHSFEVEGLLYGTQSGGAGDADPAQVIQDYLTNADHGVGFPSALLDTTTLLSSSAATTTGDMAHQTYCRAMGFGISPALVNQEQASDAVQRWCDLTNTAPVWTGYSLKFIPYGDQTVTANGVTYLPSLPVVFNFTDADYIQQGDADPLIITRTDQADAYNVVSMAISDRSNAYNAAPISWHDQNMIDLYGRREASSIQADEVCSSAMAANMIALIGQRTVYVRNTFTFTIDPRYSALEPMDIVTVSDTRLGLSAYSVRVVTIDEDDNGNLKVEAEDYSGQTGTPSARSVQSNAQVVVNSEAAPGDVNTPIIFEPPVALAGSVPQVWIAASGGASGVVNANWGGCYVWVSTDNVNYTNVGTINQPARMGSLSAALAASSTSPDTTDTLAVNLAQSGGALASTTTINAASGQGSLCYVGGELISFVNATLTGANAYNLTTLYRGQFGTTGAAHASGAAFARLDGSQFVYDLPAAYIGQTLYFKFQSFNIWGGALEALSAATAYTYTPTGVGYSTQPPWTIYTTGAPAAPASLTAVGGYGQNVLQWPISTSTGVSNYKVYAQHVGTGGAFGSATLIGSPTGNGFVHSGLSASDAWTYWVTAVNASAQESTTQAGPTVGTTLAAVGGPTIGAGAPTGTSTTGAIYFNSSTTPYTEYVYNGGWKQVGVSSGGGSAPIFGTGAPGIVGTLTLDGTGTGTFTGSSSGSATITTTKTNDVIVVLIGNEGGGAIRTVTSVAASGLTFTRRGGSSTATDNQNLEIWWAPSAAIQTSLAITVTMTGNVDDGSIGVFAVNGCNNISSPWDTGTLPVVTTGSPAAAPTFSTNQAHDFIFAASSSNYPSAETSAWTTLLDVNNGGGSAFMDVRAFYEIVSATQTGATASLTSGNSYINVRLVDALTSDTTTTYTDGTIYFDQSTSPYTEYVYKSGAWHQVGSSGGGATLAGLSDVSVTEGSGIDGQYLKWNNAAGKWIPGTPSGSGGGGGAAPPVAVQVSSGARVGDTSSSATLTFASGATAGNLILILFTGFSSITCTVPTGFTALPAYGQNNQGFQAFYKVAAGGETSLAVSINTDHGQFLAYEVSNVNVIQTGASFFTSGGSTWSANWVPSVTSALVIGMFEYDVYNPTVGVSAPSGVISDYAPNSGASSSSYNHQGDFFRLPANYFGPVTGSCGAATNAMFATIQLGGGATTTNPFGFAYSRSVSSITITTTVARFDSGIAWYLPAGLATCRGKVDTAPTATTVFNIAVGGTNVGTMTFAAGSTTATFAMSTAQTIAAGTSVSVIAPSNLNGMAGLLDFTITGTR